MFDIDANLFGCVEREFWQDSDGPAVTIASAVVVMLRRWRLVTAGRGRVNLRDPTDQWRRLRETFLHRVTS